MTGDDRAHDPTERYDVDEFLRQLRDDDLKFVADYFEMVLKDYDAGEFPEGSDNRYWDVEEETDISRFIDLAIMFGVEWERDENYD